MTSEFWMPIVGFEGAYAVSDHGRVKSLGRVVTRKNGSPLTVRSRILKAGLTSAGYCLVGLSVGGKPISFNVHSLVAEAFIGTCPPNHEVDHRNGVRNANHLGNLRYATRSQNNANRDALVGSASSFKGVVRWPDGRWRAQISAKHIGLFEREADAARAYDAAAREHYGEFARINFPEGQTS